MLFYKPQKIALLRPPKVGTFTATHFLEVCGWKPLGGPHGYLKTYAEKYPNLLNYKVYCFFRDLLARFESKILHVKQIPMSGSIFQKIVEEHFPERTVETISYEEVTTVYPFLKEKFPLMFSPQVVWFSHPNVYPLDFANIESELRRISGNYEAPMLWHNKSTDYGRSVITDKVREFVRDYYAVDYQFAKDVLNKEY